MGILRFVGLVNASIWLGAALFGTLLIPMALFSSPEIKSLLGASHEPYAGAIAQTLFKRFFHLQLACAVIATLHLFATWLYLGRAWNRLVVWVVLGLLGYSLAADFGLHPKLQRLHVAKYHPKTELLEREAAAKSLKRWHALSTVANLFALAALLYYHWRLAHPGDAPRFISSAKFKG
jgi:hypothetical protein